MKIIKKINEFKNFIQHFSMEKLLKFSVTANSLTASHRISGPDHLQLDRYDCINTKKLLLVNHTPNKCI